jgi:hypothetical protein
MCLAGTELASGQPQDGTSLVLICSALEGSATHFLELCVPAALVALRFVRPVVELRALMVESFKFY